MTHDDETWINATRADRHNPEQWAAWADWLLEQERYEEAAIVQAHRVVPASEWSVKTLAQEFNMLATLEKARTWNLLKKQAREMLRGNFK